MDPEWRLTSDNGSYIYPDLETAYNGLFRGGVMVAGRAAIVEADCIREGVLRVKARRTRRREKYSRESLNLVKNLEACSSHNSAKNPINLDVK